MGIPVFPKKGLAKLLLCFKDLDYLLIFVSYQMPIEYTFIGPYRLEETLGSGSFGKVKRTFKLFLFNLVATHQHTQLKVAIKILSKEKINKLDMSSKVKREINILRSFKHPHIVRLYVSLLVTYLGMKLLILLQTFFWSQNMFLEENYSIILYVVERCRYRSCLMPSFPKQKLGDSFSR